jgi:hypothetical protein
MNYLVYFKDTGKISHTSSTEYVDDKMDSIEISFDDMNDFLSNKKNIAYYCVISDSELSDKKELMHINDFEEQWNHIENKIYKIEKTTNSTFVIEQDTSSKTCRIKTFGLTKERLKKHQIENMVFAACLGDPHLPLWVWNVTVADIINDSASTTYTSTDSFIFYTKKILDNYSHELV